MSSFGGININIQKNNIDALISSANKCLEGIPGFSFSIIKKNSLLQSKGNANSLSLDLFDQWTGFLKNNQWRFTPPTHSIIALSSALEQLKKEGGVNSRNKRYKNLPLSLQFTNKETFHIIIMMINPFCIFQTFIKFLFFPFFYPISSFQR